MRLTQDVDLKVLVSNLDYAGVRALLTRAFPKPARRRAPKNPFIENWLSQFAEALEKPEMLIEYKRLFETIKALT